VGPQNFYDLIEQLDAVITREVNHETGHAFGLRDGGPTAPYPNQNTPCEGWTEPGRSIMHDISYGCGTNETWLQRGTRRRSER